jgi:hypothetical protein
MHQPQTLSFTLVGNKCDEANREVSSDEAIALAKEFEVDYIETSALTGLHVETALRRCVLSVCSMLPDVKTHLGMSPLPAGWISLSGSLPVRCNSSMGSLNTCSWNSNGVVDEEASSGNVRTGSPVLKIGSESEDKPGFALTNNPSASHSLIYMNYWTGEETPIVPVVSAPTMLLFDSVEHKKNEELKRLSRYVFALSHTNELIMIGIAVKVNQLNESASFKSKEKAMRVRDLKRIRARSTVCVSFNEYLSKM